MKPSGGPPNSPFFYKNPQFLIGLDQNLFIDKSRILSTNIDAMITWDCNTESSVRLFLCKPGEHSNNKNHKGRISYVDSDNIAVAKDLKIPYSKGEAAAACMMSGGKHYTAVCSAFNMSDAIGGTITLESDHPMTMRMLPEEGAGYIKKVFKGEFEF